MKKSGLRNDEAIMPQNSNGLGIAEALPMSWPEVLYYDTRASSSLGLVVNIISIIGFGDVLH